MLGPALLFSLVAVVGSGETAGETSVWQPSSRTWLTVHSCAEAPKLAWVGETLYIGCPGHISRWTPGQSSATPIENEVLRQLSLDLVAGGQALLIASNGTLWRYRARYDMVEKVARLPGDAIDIGECSHGLCVATTDADWVLRGRKWRRISPPPKI